MGEATLHTDDRIAGVYQFGEYARVEGASVYSPNFTFHVFRLCNLDNKEMLPADKCE